MGQIKNYGLCLKATGAGVGSAIILDSCGSLGTNWSISGSQIKNYGLCLKATGAGWGSQVILDACGIGTNWSFNGNQIEIYGSSLKATGAGVGAAVVIDAEDSIGTNWSFGGHDIDSKLVGDNTSTAFTDAMNSNMCMCSNGSFQCVSPCEQMDCNNYCLNSGYNNGFCQFFSGCPSIE